ncbi:YkvA family protein [Bacteroides sp. 519]|uniref:YkvA family protein n=1 Tax=Bacteroides sp. 519 TaxID=2302937 RepID=UPI0013D4F626|nr:YkvA family protein [Bacteroides sp. 519]NDV59089.1 DUF1232 domain-containing protein [Bacteroides sp. 519]
MKQENNFENTENFDTPEKLEKYEKEYSENSLMDKIAKFAKKAGAKTIYAVFLCYYALQDENFPKKQKMIIIGALGYFILPIDLIPDAIPFAGFTDDLAALAYALYTVWVHITPEIQEKARNKVISIFGEVKEEDLILF